MLFCGVKAGVQGLRRRSQKLSPALTARSRGAEHGCRLKNPKQLLSLSSLFKVVTKLSHSLWANPIILMIWVSLSQGTFYFFSEDSPDSHATSTVLQPSPCLLHMWLFLLAYCDSLKVFEKDCGLARPTWNQTHEIRPLDMFQELSLLHSLFN